MSLSVRQVWSERMRRYGECSLTVAAFCRAEGVSVPNFYQWEKKLADAMQATQPAFVPLSLTASPNCELLSTLPGGATIALAASADEVAMRKVLASVVAVTAVAATNQAGAS